MKVVHRKKEQKSSYNEKAKVLFQRAIKEANQGKDLQSVESATEALMYAKQSGAYERVYIHSFLAMMFMDFSKNEIAKIHCFEALQSLRKDHRHYGSDHKYLIALNDEIEKTLQPKAAM
ncbi:MAG: hypothetical protein HKN92_04685 [Chitinophagales bacterium]|nr:hypothetical protein [Chitinophagales bacterium]